ncbi:hypothetical protein EDD37DRAFT_603536 [Exophiala viscosa]|uniref:uncharacterized protein n=1 Tax=Exophiala viscosa TaxID=2486360 RepID=UPI00219A2694|nr:hypothetical protein EDD37DRAFT_603536 [Exophiala viscosa]
MEDTSRIWSSPPSPNRVLPHPISAANRTVFPYYSFPYSASDRHDPAAYTSDALPTRSGDPHRYNVRIIDSHPPVKDGLTSWRPPLRKKPKLITTALDVRTQENSLNTGMSKSPAITKVSSVPSSNNTLGALSPLPITNVVSQPPTPLQRTDSLPLQRSPSHKRPPESHSSHGVETTCGPPPSYSTQRTRSEDKIRHLYLEPGQKGTSSNTHDASSNRFNDPIQDFQRLPNQTAPLEHETSLPSSTESSADEANTVEASSPETADTTPDTQSSNSLHSPTVGKLPAMASSRIYAEQESPDDDRNLSLPTDEESKGSSSDERKSEDLFLNIAKTDASQVGQPPSRIDKRRSRISLPFFSGARPATSYTKSSPVQDRFDTASVSGRSEALRYYSKRASLGGHVPGALSRAYTQDTIHTLRAGDAGLQQDSRSIRNGDLPRAALSRRYSNTNTNNPAETARHSQRPSTTRNSRLVSEAGFTERTRPPLEHNATESTISTTAPSTIFDELDDLKSRIRKLELTGKLPPSSAAAMATSDRPKTATTAATTLSSSPRHKPATVQLQSAIEGIPSTIHPNLHEALGTAKAVVSNDLYQKLQATAHDALQLSVMMSPEGYTGSTVGGSSLSERQVRRRTESMCRSLTELVIAMLADSKQAPSSAARPVSRDAYASSSVGLRSRRYSNETSDRPPVSSRVQSRLDNRRTSIGLGTTFSTHVATPGSGQESSPTALPQIQTTSSSRLGRTSTLTRKRRIPGQLDGTTDEEVASPSARPLSRAMTELGTHRLLVRDPAAYSRDYTAQHPLPQHPRHSPHEPSNATRSSMPSNVSTNFVSRRKHTSPASNMGTHERTPVTPKEHWGRISIIPAATSSPIEATPESQGSLRPSNSRRSMGFASRISSVSSRLRAVKAERNNVNMRDSMESPRDIAPSDQELDNMAFGRQDSGQSSGS